MEKDLMEEFQKLCDTEGKSMSLKIHEIMAEELQKKNALGLVNPINISFNNNIKLGHIEPLDKYLEDRSVSSADYWRDYFRKKDSYEDVMKYEALSLTIHKQAKNRANYLKTGRYLVQ